MLHTLGKVLGRSLNKVTYYLHVTLVIYYLCSLAFSSEYLSSRLLYRNIQFIIYKTIILHVMGAKLGFDIKGGT
jgi:hypothetical protein